MPQLTALLLMQAASTSNGGDIIPSLPPASAPASASMDRTSQWVSSPDIPADLIIRIADDVFPLHKSVMVPKCGYIRKAVAAARGGATATVELDLSSLPGGADAFDKAARYCYGHNFEISIHNAAALLCAAAFLDMHPSDGGLARRVDEFLAKVALRTLPGAVAVLRSCEAATVSSAADEETGVARRAADSVALRICNEVLFPTRSPPDWWAAELAALSPPSFHKVVTALRCRRADPEVLAAASISYAELVLAAGGDHDAGARRAMVESVVAVLPSTDDAPLPAAFLCRLLHAAITIGASATTCRDMEHRVVAVLDTATAGDLLAITLDAAGEHIQNTDTIRRIITAFVDRNTASLNNSRSNRRSSLSGAADIDGESAMQAVAKTVDELAAEMATEEMLPISKFVAVAGAVPKEARATHDGVYRAVDIYLKAHPWLDEMEREKVCSVMDPLKLSYQGRLHASQNKRLPLQAVLTALYYDQLNLRSSNGNEMTMSVRRSEAGSVRKQAKAEASLARENEALRSELARMRAYVSGMQQSKGSSSSSAMGKKGMSLWSRTLSMLNPFKAGGIWAKDTSSINDRKTTVAKPKRRRFSIS